MNVDLSDLFAIMFCNMLVNACLACAVCIYIPSFEKYLKKIHKIIKEYYYEN